MGKSKKPFIAKGDGQKFVLLHRSQTDAAYAEEKAPSEYVLVRSDQIGETRNDFADKSYIENNYKLSGESHVTELGFKNDGYDYTKHLKQLGGGKFIGKDGKVVDMKFDEVNSNKFIDLPEEILPSNLKELERDLRAITISHEFMDEDLKDALFGEDATDFEELDDDFVINALKEPKEPDFDYDAHIAYLIAQSERLTVSNQKPRGWDDEDDDEDDDDEDNENDEPTDILDKNFEKLLEEYDDDELGDLPYIEESEIQGKIDDALEDSERNEIFDSALDDYLKELKDSQLATGILVKKGTKIVPLQIIDDEEFERNFNKESVTEEEKFKILAKEAEQVNLKYLEDVHNLSENDDEIVTCQEYLRETRVEEMWDCETIISSMSVLDNHPKLIPKPISNKNKEGRSTSSEASTTNSLNGLPAPKIILSGKYNLPLDYVNNKQKKVSTSSIVDGVKNINLELYNRKKFVKYDENDDIHIKNADLKISEKDSYNRDSDSDSNSFESDTDDSSSKEKDQIIRKKQIKRKETPEEKKLRKSMVF